MSGEGRFFTTLGADVPTYVPGGADVDGPLKLTEEKFIREFFNVQPVCSAKTGAAVAVADGSENVMCTGENVFEYHIITSGGNATIAAPVLEAAGLNVEGDGADLHGLEYCVGILSSNKAAFVVGTAPAFYAKLQFEIDDVSDFDECAFGFRKAEPYQKLIDGYDEMACINVQLGVINIETILNNGDTTTTDTTLTDWVDGGTHTIEVLVSAAGAVTYKFDESPPTKVAAFTFDEDEVVVPFFHFLHAASAASGLHLKHFECGYQ